MNKEEIISLLVVLWSAGILTAIARFLIKLAKSHIKDNNVRMFLNWVDQAVMYAEKNFVGSENKKHEAYNVIVQRIRANKLAGRFSEEQIMGALELAVSQLTDDTTGLKKPEKVNPLLDVKPVVIPEKKAVLDDVVTSYTLDAE